MHGPLSLDGNSIEESHRLIDEAIAHHRASILALKSQKNGLASISRLPPELLCKIFLFLTPACRGQFNPSYHPSCVAVTQVCSHWRHVAVNSPSLWVKLPLWNIRWVEEMLKRSKNAGLVIDADFGTRRAEQGFKLVLKQRSPIKHLSVQSICNSSVRDDLQRELPRLAPWLEYLNLDEHDYDGSTVVIPEGFLSEIQRLQYLELHQCNINWDSNPSLLPSLTHLTLHRCALDSKPTGQYFMDALKGMPNLEFLDIENGLPLEQMSSTSEHIHFASLQSLSLRSEYAELKTFLLCVTFPPTAIVKVECVTDRRDSISNTDISGIILGLSQSYSDALPDATFQTLIISPIPHPPYDVLLRLFTYFVADEQIFKHRTLTANLELSFRWEPKQPPMQHIATLTITDIFNDAIPLLKLQGVTRIYLERPDVNLRDPETIANTFGKLPRVRSAVVDEYSSKSFLNALRLGPYVETGSIGPVEKLYFPCLSMMHFRGTMFCESERMTHPFSVSVESLQNCLVQRFKFGAKIEKLTLRACHEFRQSDVDSLARIVPDIDWDRVEGFDEWDEYERDDHDYEDWTGYASY